MKPFDFAQDRLRGIQDATKNPGLLHPGYKEVSIHIYCGELLGWSERIKALFKK